MGKTRSLLLAFVIVALLVWRSPAANASLAVVSFADGEFNPVQWETHIVFADPGTEVTTANPAAGGNPGAYRHMSHALPEFAGSEELMELSVGHIYLDDFYDPGADGPLDYIDYSEDAALRDLPWAEAFIDSRPALRQGGEVYYANSKLRTQGDLDWHTMTMQGLQADDFWQRGAPNSHPDFSAGGAPIYFGFLRQTVRLNADPPFPPDQPLTLLHAIDNWQVMAVPVGGSPPPPPPGNRAPTAVDDTVLLSDETLRGFFSVSLLLANDYDEDGDDLSVSTIGQPDGGIVFGLHGDLYEYNALDWVTTYDSLVYTISDGVLTDNGNVYFVIDCSCVLECFASPLPQSGREAKSLLPTAAAWLASRLSLPLPQAEGSSHIDLDLLRGVRDKVMRPTEHGQRYVDMYYRTTTEIVKILVVDSDELRSEALSTVGLWQDNLRNLVNGDGSAIISQAQVNAAKSFLANLSAAGSADLQQTISAELARLGSLDSYAGLTVGEAAEQILGDQILYLPALTGN